MSTFYVELTFYIATDQEVYTKMIVALHTRSMMRGQTKFRQNLEERNLKNYEGHKS